MAKTNREMSEATDTQHAIGKVVTSPNAAARDAIHIAVLLVTAAERLYAGEKVKFKYGSRDTVIGVKNNNDDGLGIVDPFLGADDPALAGANTGEKFYVFLYPNSITGLSHKWTHPTVDAPVVTVSDAETWLQNFADQWGFHYDNMVQAALDAKPGVGGVEAQDKPYLVAGTDLHGPDALGDDLGKFWDNMEVVTGRTFSPSHRKGISWSCSC